MKETKYFQDLWLGGTCYGCGPGNPEGMHIRSRWSEDKLFVIAEYKPEEKYISGMPDVMYGGAIASLIDCHSMWTAMAFAHRAENLDIQEQIRIAYVTGRLTVDYIKPTPISKTIYLKAWVDGAIGKKVRVRCELGPDGEVTAKGDVVAVRLG